MDLYHQLFENNKAWVAAKLKINENYFKEMAKGQRPPILYIGCSDSRVPANEIMGLSSGDVFVTRNIANIVGNNDDSMNAVIHYAVEMLGVSHIIVCGHYGCGGVKAAMGHKNMGKLNFWLRNVRDVYRFHKQELDAIEDADQRYRRLVELNVHEQCFNVCKHTTVQKTYRRKGIPYVRGWVFDLETGLIKDMEIHNETVEEHLREIYRID